MLKFIYFSVKLNWQRPAIIIMEKYNKSKGYNNNKPLTLMRLACEVLFIRRAVYYDHFFGQLGNDCSKKIIK